MRPGFHSGTIPKIYAKLRKAERRAYRPRQSKTAHTQREALHHVEECIRHFIDREFVTLLRESKSWGSRNIAVGAIALGSDKVRIQVCCPDLGKTGFWIAFEEQAGWLIAGIPRPGCLYALSQGQARALRTALAGLYKFAGVHLIREEIEACFDPRSPAYTVTEEGLVVWPDGKFQSEAVYDLTGKEATYPKATGSFSVAELPALDPGLVIYTNVPVTWESWVQTWELDQAGKGHAEAVAPEVRFFPPADRLQCHHQGLTV
jgi:hypothetical protein